MANIKNLRMAYTISTDARISVRKSLFGLSTTLIYNPTGSIVDARVVELTSADGNHLRWNILCASAGDIQRIIGNFQPKPVNNGNYLAELCMSRDEEFLAIQLLQFSTLNYEPVTDVLIYEGDDARALAKLFK